MSRSKPADVADHLVGLLQRLLPARRPLGLNEPSIGMLDKTLVTDCLDSGWVSSSGAFLERFERALAEITGLPHVIATVNGTAALHVVLRSCGVAPGDEVLVPSLTFVGTVNPVCQLGAVPHLVDVEPETLGIDPASLAEYLAANCEPRDGGCFNAATGRRVAAMIGVHVLGHPCHAPALAALCADHGITFIEDAAESLGATRDGRHTGHWGRASAFSFNGNKIVTTGGGGAVLTDDAALAAGIRHLTTTAKQPHAWEFIHDQWGFNYRLPNLNAALGCAQLADLERRLAQRRVDAARLADALAGIDGLALQRQPASCQSNHWLHLVLVGDRQTRDAILARAHDDGIQLRPLWRPLHLQQYLTDCPRTPCPVAEDLYQRGVCLPAVLADDTAAA